MTFSLRSSMTPLAFGLLLTACPDDGALDDDGPIATTGEASSTSEPAGTTLTEDPASSSDDADGSGSTLGADGESSSDDADSTSSDGGESTTGTTGQPEVCGVVLAEVVFDPTGDDDEFQWVKLKNLCSYEIDLSSWTIGYGGPHYGDNRQKQLDAPEGAPGLDTVIPAFGCYLVGGPQTGDANGSPVYNLPEDFAPGLRYDEAIGSGIALFDMPPAMVDETTIPLDAVVYGPNNDAGLIDSSGAAVAAPHVGLPPAGGSITRTGAEAQWDLNVAPQAGDCPNF